MVFPAKLRILLLVAIVLFFVIVIALLKKKRLALKYTLVWLLTGLVMLILVIFPQIMVALTTLVGMQSSMNTLYILLIGFLLLLTMMLTSIVSSQTDRITRLAQANALLEKRVRELEANVGETSSSDD